MNMLRATLLASIAFALAGCSSHRQHAAEPPATRPATSTSPVSRPIVPPLSQPSYHLSEVTEQTLPAYANFASVTTRTTFKDLKAAIDAAMTELTGASGRNALQFIGAPIFIYRGASGTELDKPFSLEIGFPVAPGGKAEGKIVIKPLAEMKSLAISFEGPISAIDKGYSELFPAVGKRKARQTGEVREVYNRWEGGDSLHNQILIAVGIE
jgi:effector-binding domain-containing protein